MWAGDRKRGVKLRCPKCSIAVTYMYVVKAQCGDINSQRGYLLFTWSLYNVRWQTASQVIVSWPVLKGTSIPKIGTQLIVLAAR